MLQLETKETKPIELLDQSTIRRFQSSVIDISMRQVTWIWKIREQDVSNYLFIDENPSFRLLSLYLRNCKEIDKENKKYEKWCNFLEREWW